MFIVRGSVFVTSNVRMTVNNEMRKMVKKGIFEYFVLMFRRSTFVASVFMVTQEHTAISKSSPLHHLCVKMLL